MGEDVKAAVFRREDRQRYRQKVRACLDVFARMLAESRFDNEPRSTGVELELYLTDEAGDPALLNAEVLERIADPSFQTELAQFNLEVNFAPLLLRNTALRDLETEMNRRLEFAGQRAAEIGARLIMIGILPTLGDRHLTREAFSANPRYGMLNEQILWGVIWELSSEDKEALDEAERGATNREIST